MQPQPKRPWESFDHTCCGFVLGLIGYWLSFVAPASFRPLPSAALELERSAVEESTQSECTLSAIPGTLISFHAKLGSKFQHAEIEGGFCRVTVYYRSRDASAIGAVAGEVFVGLNFKNASALEMCSKALEDTDWHNLRIFDSLNYPAPHSFDSTSDMDENRGGWSCGDPGYPHCSSSDLKSCGWYFGTMPQDGPSDKAGMGNFSLPCPDKILASPNPIDCLIDLEDGQVRLGTQDKLVQELVALQPKAAAWVDALKWIGFIPLGFSFACCFIGKTRSKSGYEQVDTSAPERGP